MWTFRAALIAGAVVASPVAAALAHVVAHPNTAIAGTSFTAGFLVAHGCDGSPTVALRVTLPDGVTAAKPDAKAGWTIVGTGREIAWRGGPLAAHSAETFTVTLKLPDTPGRTLYFPAVQECQQGIRRWIEIPAASQDPKALRTPAPFVTLTRQP